MSEESTVVQELMAALVVQMGGSVGVRAEYLEDIGGKQLSIDYDVQQDIYYVRIEDADE